MYCVVHKPSVTSAVTVCSASSIISESLSISNQHVVNCSKIWNRTVKQKLHLTSLHVKAWFFISRFFAIRESPQNHSTIPPLFIGPYATANDTVLLAWSPSQGTKLYCLVNRSTLGVNNLPRVVACCRIMPRSESNLRPLDHESNALPLHYRVTLVNNQASKTHKKDIDSTYTVFIQPCSCSDIVITSSILERSEVLYQQTLSKKLPAWINSLQLALKTAVHQNHLVIFDPSLGS